MAASGKDMYEGQPGTGDTLLYTAAANGAAVVAIHVCNTTTSAATITLGLRSGAALAAANHFLSAMSIPPNGTYDWEGWHWLAASATIRALQGTGSALTVTISGLEA